MHCNTFSELPISFSSALVRPRTVTHSLTHSHTLTLGTGHHRRWNSYASSDHALATGLSPAGPVSRAGFARTLSGAGEAGGGLGLSIVGCGRSGGWRFPLITGTLTCRLGTEGSPLLAGQFSHFSRQRGVGYALDHGARSVASLLPLQ